MKAVRLLMLKLGLVFSVGAQPLSPGLISVREAPSVSGSSGSYQPVLSGDGRYIVFLSSAKDIVPDDNLSPHLDLFRHDIATGHTIRIAAGLDRDLRTPAVSSNGGTIAFADGTHVYSIDANTLVRTLVSVDRNGNPPSNPVRSRNVPLSDKPLISADGRWIAFESFATNLTAETDRNIGVPYPSLETDVFLRDTASNQTILISVARQGGITGDKKSVLIDMTPDGKYVLFASTGSNLAATNPTYGFLELFVRDVAAGVTTWVSHAFFKPYYACNSASISDDGRFVLYKLEFEGDTVAHVRLHDRLANTNAFLTGNARAGFPVSMSSDARFVAYDEHGDLYLWDSQTGLRTRINVNVGGYATFVSDDGLFITFLRPPTGGGDGAGIPPPDPASTYQLYYRKMTTNEQRSITRTVSGTPSAEDYQISSVAVHPTGDFVVFDGAEKNLVPDDRNHASDIFVHFVATGETRLISLARSQPPAFTPVRGASITNHCISADGLRILFFSHDSNLVPGDTNGCQDAFLRDLRSERTFALSTDANEVFRPANSALHGVLSADGRFALLGLVPARSEVTLNTPATIIRKDLETGETLPVVSNLFPNDVSFPTPVRAMAFSLSADGRWVTYPSNNNIILADMQTRVQTNLTPSDPNWTEPAISSDGRYVLYAGRSPRALAFTDLSSGPRVVLTNEYTGGAAFTQNAESIVYGSAIASRPTINLYSIAGGASTLVCTSCWNPQISADGRYVAYQTIFTPYQIEVRDMQTAKTTVVTRNIHGTGGANRDATWPVISTDGRFVAYTTKSTNLTTHIPNGWNNLYIYDRLQGSTLRLAGNASSSRPVISPNGRTLVFQSFASDFVTNDFNDTRDIFLLTLGGDDTDNDGMPDDWEQTHFSTTDRDGTGDFDQDGQTDLAEYLAGTNPNDGQSVLEVLQITSVNTGQRQLIWNAQPGKSYRLEYKPDLAGAAWTSLGHVITATQPTASAVDTTAAAEKRFYRVALVQ